jgi:polysaccharide pyruvyl transferase WcaK-like protein
MNAAPRVGLFGLLGSGNIGNDASLEAVLGYLRSYHPDAFLDAMCMGSEQVRASYGIDTIPLLWYRKHEQRASGAAAALKVLGKALDTFRIAAWVRQHDVVIVPGMGVLEATTPLHPWGVPYTMFLLSASGRLFRTKVALVGVGANRINQRMTRWLFIRAARLAFFRSYRDVQSRDALREQGVDTSRDPVHPDLVFSLPMSPVPGSPEEVGVGLMAYYGTNDDRRRADELHASYIGSVESFIRWLLDGGRRVRLFYGDAVDEPAVQQVMTNLREYQSDPGSPRLTAEHITSYAKLSRAMAPVGAVVATRYHNVICALQLGKPTISLGYAKKNVALMDDMGLPEFCQHAHSIDVVKLTEQFTKLESNADQVRTMLAERNADKVRLLADQFAALDVLLFPPEEIRSKMRRALLASRARGVWLGLLPVRTAEHEHGVRGRRAEQLDDELLVEAALVGHVHEIPDSGARAIHVHERGAASGHQVRDENGPEVHAVPGPAGRVRRRGVQLGPGEQQDVARGRQDDELLAGLVVDGPRPRLALAGHLGRGGQPARVVLVVIERVRGVRDGAGEAVQVESHGVVLPDREDREPPVDLLGRRAVPDVAVPGEREGHARVQVPQRKRSPRLGQVVVGLLGRETCLLDDRPHQLLRPLCVDEAGLPRAQDLRHLGRLDVVVHELRVMRPEQLGEFVTRVVDEIGERLQASQDDQVPGVELLPQLATGHIRVNDDAHLLIPFLLVPAGTITDFAHLKASAYGARHSMPRSRARPRKTSSSHQSRPRCDG